MSYDKPLPTPSRESAPFWEGCRRHQLILQQCEACDAYRLPPATTCPKCWSRQTRYVAAEGKGTVHTFATYRRLYHPAFEADMPYVVAVVTLAEGPRLLSNIIGCPADEVRCDMPVEVIFRDVTEAISLPMFRPAGLA